MCIVATGVGEVQLASGTTGRRHMYRSWSELRRSPFLLAARSRDGPLRLAAVRRPLPRAVDVPPWRASDTNVTAPPNGHRGVPGYHAGDAHADNDPEHRQHGCSAAHERPHGPGAALHAV